MLNQTEPLPGLRERDWFWELSDVFEDVIAGFDSIRGDPEACELQFLLKELEFLLIEGSAVVATKFKVVEGVEEVASDVIIVEECVVHYLALVDDILHDVIHPLGVGISRTHMPLWGSAVAVSSVWGDDGGQLS